MKLDYNTKNVPPDYFCYKCGSNGVKLWRLYNTFLDHQKLTCVYCSGENEDVDISSVDEGGMIDSDYGVSDQIGSLIPAVPTNECDSYWGYTSVPQDGVDWWKRLGLKSLKEIRKDKLDEIENRQKT